jgi:hypothetical protein
VAPKINVNVETKGNKNIKPANWDMVDALKKRPIPGSALIS